MTETSQQMMRRWEREAADAAAQSKATITQKTDALKAAGVAVVVCEFSGYGDEGSINTLKYFSEEPDDPGDEPTINENTIPKVAQPDSEDFYPLLPGGYDQNEGSAGTVTWTLETGRFVLSIDWNVTTTENDTKEI